MIDISKAFGTPAEPIAEFYQRPGDAYYIPLYQREYSWDQENIDQLMDDISNGVESILDDDNTIRFMGTVILLREVNAAANIHPQDMRALPGTIFNVIDGQQRISTIAILACLLYQKIFQKGERLSKEQIFDELRDEIDSKLEILVEMFSVDLKRGNPKRKPVIVRGSVDGWTFDGDDEANYKSDVSSYIAKFIRAINDKRDFPQPKADTIVGNNFKAMSKKLKKIEDAHEDDIEDVFPPAWVILDKIDEKHIWSYSRPSLKNLIINRSTPMTKDQIRVCSLVQLFAFMHFLLYRCCFIQIEPTKENWAFDMFQSLNASGTPLTAIETFKPLVVNTVNTTESNYKGSKSEEYFGMVDDLLGKLKSAATKNKLTNEFLTILALIHDGSKQPAQFSSQRTTLTRIYSNKPSKDEKQEVIRRMGELALYWKRVIEYDPNNNLAIQGTELALDEDKNVGALCALYLNDSGHKMANTIMSRFYSQILRNRDNSHTDFLNCCKVLAAFYTLWRSVYSNSGLDDVYRKLLKGDSATGIPQFSAEGGDINLTLHNLKSYLKSVLIDKRIGTKDEWKARALQYFKYDTSRSVCKFALFIASHDTIIDIDSPGLMKIGTTGTYPYLDPLKWVARDFKSVEHVAPRRPPSDSEWDSSLYTNDDFDLIGNLTLLPTEINSSAGNKGWLQKLTYYKHLSETDPDNLASLKKHAEYNGIELAAETITLLMNTSHKHHIRPLVEVGYNGKWDKELIERRTNRICDILWDRIINWLE